MKLKLDDAGHVVVQDNKPVYVDDNNREIAFDYPSTLATISRLNGESKTHREAKEAAEGKLRAFEGIDDPEKARKALETVKNLDDKRLVDAGEVERIKAEAKSAFDEQLKALEKKHKPVEAERDSLRSELKQERIGMAFGRSKYIGEKLAIPVDLVQARFGSNFDIEDGKIVAKDAAGNRVYSLAKPGEIAEFDEALEILVSHYPNRDNILKGSGGSGGGAGGSGGGNSGKKQMTRAQFDALSAADRMAAMKAGTAISD
jgi:hypothetical protein